MRDKRLEQAKKIIKDMVQFIENVSVIGTEDTYYLDWLIEQGELVTELESEKETLSMAHDKNQREISKLKNEKDKIMTWWQEEEKRAAGLQVKIERYHVRTEIIEAKNWELIEQNKRYRELLRKSINAELDFDEFSKLKKEFEGEK